MPINVEIKARCENIAQIRHILEEKQADFKGIDHQIDTYFVVPNGRLKLRQGSIENNLIHYNRPNQAGPKVSEVALYSVQDSPALCHTLTKAMGILAVVDKKRGIYFIENVKFHLDEVQQLGTFVEIEAIDHDGTFSQEALKNQCDHYMALFDIQEKNLINVSYSDLLMQQ